MSNEYRVLSDYLSKILVSVDKKFSKKSSKYEKLNLGKNKKVSYNTFLSLVEVLKGNEYQSYDKKHQALELLIYGKEFFEFKNTDYGQEILQAYTNLDFALLGYVNLKVRLPRDIEKKYSISRKEILEKQTGLEEKLSKAYNQDQLIRNTPIDNSSFDYLEIFKNEYSKESLSSLSITDLSNILYSSQVLSIVENKYVVTPKEIKDVIKMYLTRGDIFQEDKEIKDFFEKVDSKYHKLQLKKARFYTNSLNEKKKKKKQAKPKKQQSSLNSKTKKDKQQVYTLLNEKLASLEEIVKSINKKCVEVKKNNNNEKKVIEKEYGHFGNDYSVNVCMQICPITGFRSYGLK